VISYGFFVVDSVHSTEQGTSVATKVFGQQFRDASFTIADISGAVIIIIALTTFWVVLAEFLIETRRRVVHSLGTLDYSTLRSGSAPAARKATPDAPGTGQIIRIEPADRQR
jgi:hypothetical protein